MAPGEKCPHAVHDDGGGAASIDGARSRLRAIHCEASTDTTVKLVRLLTC